MELMAGRRRSHSRASDDKCGPSTYHHLSKLLNPVAFLPFQPLLTIFKPFHLFNSYQFRHNLLKAAVSAFGGCFACSFRPTERALSRALFMEREHPTAGPGTELVVLLGAGQVGGCMPW